MSQSSTKSYLELIKLDNYTDRLNYLMLNSGIGIETFGSDRYLNQVLYHSYEWRQLRPKVIMRDNGCDLAMPGYELLSSGVVIHHINPITVDDVLERRPIVFDLNNLITCSKLTHNYIHYGTAEALQHNTIADRTANDTCPWRS